jgi:hypothetical protein
MAGGTSEIIKWKGVEDIFTARQLAKRVVE